MCYRKPAAKIVCIWLHYPPPPPPPHRHHRHHLHRYLVQVNRRYETSGQAPLHIAASNGSINAIGALVAAGARLEVDILINNILLHYHHDRNYQGEQRHHHRHYQLIHYQIDLLQPSDCMYQPDCGYY